MEPFANIPLEPKASPTNDSPSTPVATAPAAPMPVTPKPISRPTPEPTTVRATLNVAPKREAPLVPRVSIPQSELAALTPPLPSQEKSSVGPIIGVVIIVLLFAFGGLYFWGAHLNAVQERQQLPLISGDASVH